MSMSNLYRAAYEAKSDALWEFLRDVGKSERWWAYYTRQPGSVISLLPEWAADNRDIPGLDEAVMEMMDAYAQLRAVLDKERGDE